LTARLGYRRKEWHVVARPVRLVQKRFGHVTRLDQSGNLFEHEEQPSSRQLATWPKQRVIDHQPLVVVRTTVVFLEQLRPGQSIGRQPISHHRPNENHHLHNRL